MTKAELLALFDQFHQDVYRFALSCLCAAPDDWGCLNILWPNVDLTSWAITGEYDVDSGDGWAANAFLVFFPDDPGLFERIYSE